jgi:hypothetical protein
MSVWEKMKSAASATGTAITNTSSKAMSAARQTRASVTDPTSTERAKNAAVCTKASDHICNIMGKIPAPGDDMYTVQNMTVNGRGIPVRIVTPAGTRHGLEYTQQNEQAVRNALISKGIKPAVGNQAAMDKYNNDMKLFQETKDEIRKAVYQANPTHGGRKPRRRTRRHSRKPKGKASSKRSRGTKSKGKRRGSRKRR